MTSMTAILPRSLHLGSTDEVHLGGAPLRLSSSHSDLGGSRDIWVVHHPNAGGLPRSGGLLGGGLLRRRLLRRLLGGGLLGRLLLGRLLGVLRLRGRRLLRRSARP